MTRAQETKMIKDALRKAGINAMVEHGKGTAWGWGWIEIYIGSPDQFGEHIINESQSHYRCPPCLKMRSIAEQAEKIVREVTGRNGQYGRQILVLTQGHWDWKTKQEREIIQDL